MRWMLAVVLALAACVPCSGQQIVGPDGPVKAMHNAWLTVEGMGENASAAFFPSPVLTAGDPHIQPMHALFWAEQPGTYTVSAVVIDWDARSFVPLSIAIQVTGEGPNPNPNPGPDPGPEPNPEPGPRWVIWLEESGDRTAEHALIIRSRRLQQYLLENNHSLIVADDDQADEREDLKRYVERAGDELPRVFVIDASSAILYEGEPPADVDAMIELIEQYGG